MPALPARELLGLAPGGVCLAGPVNGPPVGSYPTISPITCAPTGRDHRLVCFLLHLPYPTSAGPPEVIGAPCPLVFGLSSPAYRGDGPADECMYGKDRTRDPYLVDGRWWIVGGVDLTTYHPRHTIHAQTALTPFALDQLLYGFLVEFAVHDDAAGVLAGDDSIALADFDLALRRHSESRGGASLERNHGPPDAQAGS